MPNTPRRPGSDPNKYEGKAYLTYEEAADYLGIRRSSLYTMLVELGIKTHKFKFDRRYYIALEDVKRVKEIREKPWLAGEDPEAGQAHEAA
jgi:excisionase family DNA binding protein